MIIIEKPYVSEFLKDTIEKNNIKVVETEFSNEVLSNRKINFIKKSEVVEKFQQNKETLLYTNSENAINWIEENLKFTDIPEKIQIFKNKFALRELLKPVFPDYFFTKVNFDDMEKFDIENCKFPFIIKPAIGFFSIGVNKVNSAKEWPETIKKIRTEIEQTKNLYPLEVIDSKEFIIEELIEGEEYAIDTYIDKTGTPVIVGISHHVFSSGTDFSDRIYNTSKEIINHLMPKMTEFLKILTQKTKITNFPIHIEVREEKNGRIIPIEVNPMRFGGMCTTGDLTYFSYGLNPYMYYLTGKKPNWDEILKDKDEFIYSLILLNNNSKIEPEKIKAFDYDKILSDFQNPLEIRKLDFTEYPVFGFLFTETNKNDTKELDDILHSDLKKYIILKE